jgi:hypothetical protein
MQKIAVWERSKISCLWKGENAISRPLRLSYLAARSFWAFWNRLQLSKKKVAALCENVILGGVSSRKLYKEDCMKNRIMSFFALLVLLLALSPASPAGERHPEIQAALNALQNAKGHLQAAAHDFQGHRVDAIRAVDEAIHQLQICMQYED